MRSLDFSSWGLMNAHHTLRLGLAVEARNLGRWESHGSFLNCIIIDLERIVQSRHYLQKEVFEVLISVSMEYEVQPTAALRYQSSQK
jgi:hypothetical protein